MRIIVLLFLCLFPFAATAPAQEKTPGPGRTLRIEADPDRGFAYPFYLYTPGSFSGESSAGETRTILVIPNNTGKISDDAAFHEENVKRKMVQAAFVFDRLGAAVLMPVFPRPESDWKIYTHALDRDSLTTERKEYARFDLQLAAMIDAARRELGGRGIETDPKVLMYGYSASGMFVNRFVFLHPERVRAAAIGSPGGWPLAPVAVYGKKRLPYPVGVADLPELTGRRFDLEALRKVPLFLYLGDLDDNDSVVFRDGYEETDEKLIFELFGPTPVARWEASRKLYESRELNAVFRLYAGVGHTVSKEMVTDILEFFGKHGAPPAPAK